MTQSLEQVYEQLAALKTDLDDLRATYKGISKNYLVALNTLNDLTRIASSRIRVLGSTRPIVLGERLPQSFSSQIQQAS